MTDQTPNPSDFDEDHFPLRGGCWVARGQEVAQVKAVHRDTDPTTHEPEFLVDLIYYDRKGKKIGRLSDNEPFTVDGKTYRGPRAYEPMCSLVGWIRIEPPEFPLQEQWVWREENGKNVATAEMSYTPLAWGNYKKPRRVFVPAPPKPRPNFDPELEKRSRLMTAQALRDAARERGGDPDLIKRAEQLEREAAQF